MARKAKIASNDKRIRLVEKFRTVRTELRNKAKDETLSAEERFEAMIKLQELPRDSSPSRVRNRCAITGRPRSVYSKFKLSRIKFRELALQGMIPGITKSSW